MESSRKEYQEERDYFSLIQKCGSWNKYQLYLFVILSGVSILNSSLMFILPFLFHQENYECQQMEDSLCTNFVCSLSSFERISYLPQSPFNSLADSLDIDFRCQFSSLITLFSTLIFVASLTGLLIFSTFTQALGRKKSLALSLAIMIFGLVITLSNEYFQSIPMIICGILLTYCGIQNAYQYCYCFASQVVGEEWRIIFINAFNFTYGLGVIIDGIVFYYVKQWTLIYLYCFIIPAIILLLGTIFFIEKTPMDLLATEDANQIWKRLQKIAILNNVQYNLTIQEIIALQSKYFETIKRQQNKNYTVIDLFRYKSLRKLIMPLMFLNFITIYLFFAPAVINTQQESNLFASSIVQGVSFSLSVLFAYYLLAYFSRKKLGISLITLMLIAQILLLSRGTNDHSFYHTIYYTIFRVIVSITFTCIFLINYQIFPTQIRAVGASFCYIFGDLAGITQPQVVALSNSHNWNIIYSLLIITMLGYIPYAFLKETYLVPPPEIIEEIANQDKNQVIETNILPIQ